MPYQNSKLTKLLSDSLGGDNLSMTHLIVTCSPHVSAQKATLASLRFAQKAKQVKLLKKRNKRQNMMVLEKQVMELQIEVEMMKQEKLFMEQAVETKKKKEREMKLEMEMVNTENIGRNIDDGVPELRRLREENERLRLENERLKIENGKLKQRNEELETDKADVQDYKDEVRLLQAQLDQKQKSEGLRLSWSGWSRKDG